MKSIKENWKLVLIVAAGIIAVIFMCIFGVQGAQNKAFAMEEQVNTADSDIKVQEKRRVDLVYNLADCVKQYDKHEAETLANDGVYLSARKYSVTVIDSDPDSSLVGKVASMPTSRFNRHYTKDNLNHDVFEIFF